MFHNIQRIDIHPYARRVDVILKSSCYPFATSRNFGATALFKFAAENGCATKAHGRR